MRVLILGVGDAFSREHYGSSALIEAPQGYVLLDCPDLVMRVLRRAFQKSGWSVEASQINDLIITHLHGDHSNGLESLGFHRWVQRVTQPGDNHRLPRIHINKPASLRVWEKLAPAMDEAWNGGPRRTLADFYDLHVIEPDRPASIAGLTVRCRFTRHGLPCTGLLISDGRRTLGWSADTPFDPDHLTWLDQADVIVHEVGGGAVHTSAGQLNSQPESIRRKLRLIHLPDDFDPSSTDLRPLREGEVLEL
jgi:ribonuclease BN (tRNA processing enzyme)